MTISTRSNGSGFTAQVILIDEHLQANRLVSFEHVPVTLEVTNEANNEVYLGFKPSHFW
jgi:hypothetical protein